MPIDIKTTKLFKIFSSISIKYCHFSQIFLLCSQIISNTRVLEIVVLLHFYNLLNAGINFFKIEIGFIWVNNLNIFSLYISERTFALDHYVLTKSLNVYLINLKSWFKIS